MERLIVGNWVQLSVFVGIVITSVVSKVDIISGSGELISWSNFFIVDDPGVGATEESVLQEHSWASWCKTFGSNSEIAQNIVIWSCDTVAVNIETIFGNHLLEREIEIWRHLFTECNQVLHCVQRLKVETLWLFRNINLMMNWLGPWIKHENLHLLSWNISCN